VKRFICVWSVFFYINCLIHHFIGLIQYWIHVKRHQLLVVFWKSTNFELCKLKWKTNELNHARLENFVYFLWFSWNVLCHTKSYSQQNHVTVFTIKLKTKHYLISQRIQFSYIKLSVLFKLTRVYSKNALFISFISNVCHILRTLMSKTKPVIV
jgi:hypothetical protein